VFAILQLVPSLFVSICWFLPYCVPQQAHCNCTHSRQSSVYVQNIVSMWCRILFEKRDVVPSLVASETLMTMRWRHKLVRVGGRVSHTSKLKRVAVRWVRGLGVFMGGTRNLKLGATWGQGPGHRGQWKSACGACWPKMSTSFFRRNHS